jgi:hypothetical protein
MYYMSASLCALPHSRALHVSRVVSATDLSAAFLVYMRDMRHRSIRRVNHTAVQPVHTVHASVYMTLARGCKCYRTHAIPVCMSLLLLLLSMPSSLAPVKNLLPAQICVMLNSH